MVKNKFLIVEGGGFKTGFVSGVLDSFIINQFNPFDGYIGVSGGSVALSYYLSQQYRFCLKAMLILAKDKNFTKYKRTLGEEGYMDIDFLAQVANKKVKFDIPKAIKFAQSKSLHFVATNRESGKAEYLDPCILDWIDVVIASCTLPFVTKGKHKINNASYLDGGWGDGLPVRWAYENGARDIVIIRTKPIDISIKQSWSDYFGSIYFSSNPSLKSVFESAYVQYNESIKFINNPPSDLKIKQISPRKHLKSGTYTYSKKTIMNDYRYGIDLGLQHIDENSA